MIGSRRRDRAHGQGLVEFALVLPVVLLVLMMLFDFGRAVLGFHSVSNAARAGVRTAIVNQTPACIESSARNQTSGLNPTDVTVAPPAFSSPLKIGSSASVTVTYQYTPMTPIIGNIIGPRTLSSTTQMLVERVHSDPCP